MLEAVPNVSEGGSRRSSRRSARVRERRRAPRRPLGRRPPPLGLHARRRRGRARRRAPRGHRGRGRAHRPPRARRRRTRASVSPTSSRSSRSCPRRWSTPQRAARTRAPSESVTSSGFRSSSTARSGGGRRPAFFRRGGLDELRARVDVGELVPDDGPREIDLRSGAVLVGARHVLVAYNVELATGDVAVAQAIAAAVRESSGGMPGVQAIGLDLPGSGRVQVSMNVIDVDAAPLHEVVERVRAEARARGVDVSGGRARRAHPRARRRGCDGGRSRAAGRRRVAGPRARARF